MSRQVQVCARSSTMILLNLRTGISEANLSLDWRSFQDQGPKKARLFLRTSDVNVDMIERNQALDLRFRSFVTKLNLEEM